MGQPTDANGFNENIIELFSSDSEDENTLYGSDYHKQLVLYDQSVNEDTLVEAFPNPVSYKPPSVKKILPSISAYTVQCASCFKWRFIPTKKKYEEIREHIIQNPFVCATAHEWRPGVSCNDPPDVEQDRTRLWAIDKPSISQPPPGWQRNLRIRGAGSTKFADIYYTSPTSHKALRSIPEIQKHLIEHPEYAEQGVTLAQFSFQVPKPLQEDYVRVRKTRRIIDALQENTGMRMPESLEPSPGLQESIGIGMLESFEPSPDPDFVKENFQTSQPRDDEENERFSSASEMPGPSHAGPSNPEPLSIPNSTISQDIIWDSLEKHSKWNLAEDLALMSAWCIASKYKICGKNHGKIKWGRLMELYHAAQAENPENIRRKSKIQMKDRYKLINNSAQRWMVAYREAYRQKQTGMSLKDVENEAHKLYGTNGSRFNNLIVFNEVMCKHPKWSLQIDPDTCFRVECEVGDQDESGARTKRLRTSEEGDYSNPATPTSGDFNP